MRNPFPDEQAIQQKFDIKGSLHNRIASKDYVNEAARPTLKDLDFLAIHPSGISITSEQHYDNVMKAVKDDCKALKSWHIMDYSLLLGIASEADRR